MIRTSAPAMTSATVAADVLARYQRLRGKDAFFLILNPTGDNLIASTYLGGSQSDASSGLALGADGRSYLCGKTA